MWWKVYFWIYGILTVLSLFSYFRFVPWTAGTCFEVITSILTVIGTYAYVYRKHVFNPLSWKIFVWIIIFSWGFSIIYELTSLKTMFQIPSIFESQATAQISIVGLILGIVIASPAVYAMYQLGKQIKRTKSSKKKK